MSGGSISLLHGPETEWAGQECSQKGKGRAGRGEVASQKVSSRGAQQQTSLGPRTPENKLVSYFISKMSLFQKSIELQLGTSQP